MIITTGSLVGANQKAENIVSKIQNEIEITKRNARQLRHNPIVYFEEWDEPMMCSIRWASELIEIAGGKDCFPELTQHHSANDRIVTPMQVASRKPDIIIGSWCGKKFQPAKLAARDGWAEIPAVKNNFIYEIKSVDILQPGPSVFAHGLKQLENIIQQWQKVQ